MAEIIQEEKGGHGGKRRPKKHSTHIDMTPMVDLACLLITFFMLTTAFSKAKVMEIVLPEKIRDSSQMPEGPRVEADKTMHIIISGDNKLYYYVGLADPNKPEEMPQLMPTDYSKDGIRQVLLERNKDLFQKIEELNNKVTTGEIKISQDSLKNAIKELKKQDSLGPIVLIKADEFAKYGNFVDVIDEMAITSIAKYAIVEISPIELDMIKNAPK